MESAMSHRDAGRARPHAASVETGETRLHLRELYPIQPLPEEFMRLARAIGETTGTPRNGAIADAEIRLPLWRSVWRRSG